MSTTYNKYKIYSYHIVIFLVPPDMGDPLLRWSIAYIKDSLSNQEMRESSSILIFNKHKGEDSYQSNFICLNLSRYF